MIIIVLTITTTTTAAIIAVIIIIYRCGDHDPLRYMTMMLRCDVFGVMGKELIHRRAIITDIMMPYNRTASTCRRVGSSLVPPRLPEAPEYLLLLIHRSGDHDPTIDLSGPAHVGFVPLSSICLSV
jgi:hypothetical protein